MNGPKAAREFDAAIIGSDINSMVAAAMLAKAGWSVGVFEGAAALGGAVRTAEITLPGFKHDVFSGWHILFVGSQAYGELKPELDAVGPTDTPTPPQTERPPLIDPVTHKCLSRKDRMPNAISTIPDAATTLVLFLDLQEEIVKNNRTCEGLPAHAAALAKLAALHRIPAIASSVPPGGAYLPNVLSALPDLTPMPRAYTSAFADKATVEAIEASGRRTLIISGVASEIVVQRTALDALASGYAVYVTVDACGGISTRTEDAAWRRIVQAGGVTTSVTTFAAELAGDFTTELGGKTLGIMYETLGG